MKREGSQVFPQAAAGDRSGGRRRGFAQQRTVNRVVGGSAIHASEATGLSERPEPDGVRYSKGRPLEPSLSDAYARRAERTRNARSALDVPKDRSNVVVRASSPRTAFRSAHRGGWSAV